MRARGSRGFTLLELMLVVTVLAIICVMAIPAILHARMAANEASAITTLRSLSTVSEQYRVRFSSYAGSLADLQSAGYVDDRVGSGSKSGYNFVYTSTTFTFSCNGNPVTPGSTGHRYFYIDSSGVIRFSTSGVATATSSCLD